MLSKLQELALIARCIAGDDRNAFGQLVDAYSDDIRRLLMNLTCGNASLVDDLAQETFLKAYLKLRSFGGIARFRTWLFTIAYNEFITYKRRSGRFVDKLTDDIQIYEETDIDPIRSITDAMVHNAVLQLPEKERVVVQLFYFDDFSIAHISKITGMPQGSVKSYLHRGRCHLASALNKFKE